MTALNFEQARFNMVEQQIKTWHVLDQDVLDLLLRLPREDFVPAKYKEHAFTDMSIPLGLVDGLPQVMMPPKLEAYMLQALKPGSNEKVLEIGTGCGYITALLASMAGHVVTVDIDAETQKNTAAILAKQHISNVTFEVGDGSHGWDTNNTYDVIVVTGSLPVLPDQFQSQLNVGGRLFAIVGDAPSMDVLLITRTSDKEWSHEVMIETNLPPLNNAIQPERFVL